MTIHRRTKINLTIASLIGFSATVTSLAVAVPLSIDKSNQNHWNPNVFVCSKYTKEQIVDFRKENEPQTDYLTFNMSRNSIVPKTLLTNNQRFMLLTQMKRSSYDLVRFVNNNKENIKEVYKHVYNADSLNAQTDQISSIDLAKNIQNLPESLKNFSNQLKDKMSGLQDTVSTLLSFDYNTVHPSSLYQKIHRWFDINYYYSYGQDLNNLSNRLNWWLVLFDGIDQTGENIDQSSDAMEDTGSEAMDGVAVISKVLGFILKLAGFIGEHIVQNLLNNINIAEQEWKGVTTHWLFGFIYVGSSIGKVAWWGA